MKGHLSLFAFPILLGATGVTAQYAWPVTTAAPPPSSAPASSSAPAPAAGPGTGSGAGSGAGAGSGPGPHTCPGSPPSVFNASPVVAAVSCSGDGRIWESADGTWYYLQCCAASTSHGVHLGSPTATDYADCLNKCSNTTVSRRPSSPPLAFANSTEDVNINTKLCSTTCPEADGQIFVSKHGETFRMGCEKRHETQVINALSLNTFEECIESCGASPACSSVDYNQKHKNCYHSTNGGSSKLKAKIFASAHSVGCAGACKPCDSCSSSAATTTKAPTNPQKNHCQNNEIVSINGYPFRTLCNQCYQASAGNWYEDTSAKTYHDCMVTCAKDSACVGINWISACHIIKKAVAINNPGSCAARFEPLYLP
ncbi:hypothetical protein BJY01DRAFT_251166 [Aspergillus pseudoustus]|uniref:Apple domain-containing protein n=1 Tax=Aspergillus pseudoustus TaxID=1810923 RepID=A0ABR4JDB3_9EURO